MTHRHQSPKLRPSISSRWRALRAQHKRYPVWRVSSISVVAGIVLLIVSPLVIFLGERAILRDLQLIVTIVAGLLFLFLFVGLYGGLRLKREREFSGWSNGIRDYSTIDTTPDLSGIDLPGDESGCFGILAGILFTLFLSVVLVFLAWILVEVLVPLFAFALFWIFNRALRRVFALSRSSRGRLFRSAGYALFFTFMYTGWLYALLRVIEFVRMA